MASSIARCRWLNCRYNDVEFKLLSKRFRHALDFQRFTAGVINFNHCAVEQHAVFYHFKPLRHAGEEAFAYRLDFQDQSGKGL